MSRLTKLSRYVAGRLDCGGNSCISAEQLQLATTQHIFTLLVFPQHIITFVTEESTIQIIITFDFSSANGKMIGKRFRNVS